MSEKMWQNGSLYFLYVISSPFQSGKKYLCPLRVHLIELLGRTHSGQYDAHRKIQQCENRIY